MKNSKYEICTQDGNYKNQVRYERHEIKRNNFPLVLLILFILLLAYGYFNVPIFHQIVNALLG